jgi:protein FAM32A
MSSFIRGKLTFKRKSTAATAPPKKLPKVTEEILETPAERAFKEAQQETYQRRKEDRHKSSHRERIEKFNKQLSTEAEHFDIPRVGPG